MQKRKKYKKSTKQRKQSTSKFRREYGFSIEELEKKLGVSSTVIYHLHWSGDLKERIRNLK